MTDLLIEFCKVNDVEYKEKLNTADISSIKIGGKADLVLFPDSEFKLISAVNFLENYKINYKVLGNMTNILLPDTEIKTVLVKTNKLKSTKLYNDCLYISSGESLSGHIWNLAKFGYCGFLGLAGIPGSVGGMIRSNAGAYGEEISDVLLNIKVYSPAEKRIFHISNKEAKFGYRESIFDHSDLIILSAELALGRTQPELALKKLRENAKKRSISQPIASPSLGSFFKRPNGDFAARLIDNAGLRGYRIGGAQVSEKHAGFIINTGGGTSSDVKKLAEYIKLNIKNKFDICLQEEVEYFKEE